MEINLETLERTLLLKFHCERGAFYACKKLKPDDVKQHD